MDISFTFAGFIVGFIIGLTGVGGGSLMTPILVLVFSIKPAIAVGTDLLYAAITKGGGIFSHHRQGSIDWRIVRLLSMGSIPATLSAVFILQQLASRGINYEPIITSTLSIALILTSLVILFKSQLQSLGKTEPFQFIRIIHRKLCTPMTILSGAIIGILVTLSAQPSVGRRRSRRCDSVFSLSSPEYRQNRRYGPRPRGSHYRNSRPGPLAPGLSGLSITVQPGYRFASGDLPGQPYAACIYRKNSCGYCLPLCYY